MTCRGAQSIWDHFKDSHPKNKVTWLYRRFQFLLRLGLHSKFSNVSNKILSQIQTSGTDDARKRNAECNIGMLEVTGTITSTATIHRVKSLKYDAHIGLSLKTPITRSTDQESLTWRKQTLASTHTNDFFLTDTYLNHTACFTLKVPAANRGESKGGRGVYQTILTSRLCNFFQV